MDIAHDLTKLAQEITSDVLLTECLKKVEEFNKQNATVFEYSKILTKDDHNKLLESMLAVLVNQSLQDSLRFQLLSMLRLLSRDQMLVTSITNVDKYIEGFVHYLEKNQKKKTDDNVACSIETLKCLCNWIYHSKQVRDCFMRMKITKSFVEQLVQAFELDNYLFYQLRIIFLMSAYESEDRQTMVECGAIELLVDIMETVLVKIRESSSLHEVNNNILCEVLKAMFNITLELSNCSSKKILQACSSLVVLLRKLLKLTVVRESEDLVTHIAHLFVNLQKESLQNLCPKESSSEIKEESFLGHPTHYQNHDMAPVVVLLDSLKERMKLQNYVKMKEKTMAVLTAFCYVCRKIPVIRKYLRQEVLPPLVVTIVRPEERKDICGEIVRLMTTVDVLLKNMAADFLFVLCKENTTRLIRYSGYGNCAGFLSSRGLMIPSVSNADGEYSDDALSDVEDENLDVMTGATAIPKEDVLANMTEEEKEIEAEKLMNMFDRLKQLNVIKPMRVGKDGEVTELNDEEE